jgi:hypothetical protein
MGWLFKLIKLGDLPIDGEWAKAEINRLNRRTVLPLAHIKELHEWLDEKWKARHQPDIDIIRVQDTELSGANDPTVDGELANQIYYLPF